MRGLLIPGLSLMPLAAVAAEPVRPNIVLIVADDLGYGELGCYGQKLIQTPNLDRLASQGIRFRQFYAGQAVCAPSRSVLMTGRHMGHTTVRGNAVGGDMAAQSLRSGEVTIARMLQQHRYATGLAGKWGLGHENEPGAPRKQGFDTYFGFINQTHAHNHFPSFLWRNGEKVPLPNDLVSVGSVEGTGYSKKRVAYADDLFAEDACAFIEHNREKPFFLFLSLIAPHANNERMRELGDGHDVPDLGIYADKPWTVSQKAHAAMMTRMDRHVGQVVEQLQRLGLSERTVLIFTSDNGAHNEGGSEYAPSFFNASGPLRGIKRDLTEGGLRVPFIVSWPGSIKPGQVSDHVGYFGDLMATFAELSGAPTPPECDSISLVPTLLGRGKQEQHEYLYWEMYEGTPRQAVLIGSRWKAIRTPALEGRIELYDLANDIGETTNLAEKHPDILAHIGHITRAAHVPNEYWNLRLAVDKAKPASEKRVP